MKGMSALLITMTVLIALGGAQTATADVPLPHHGTGSSAIPLFWITQTGVGNAGRFEITNSSLSSTKYALVGTTSGYGGGIFASSAWGEGGRFELTNANNAKDALVGKTAGTGDGVYGLTYRGNAGVSGDNRALNGAGVWGVANNGPLAKGVYGVSTTGYAGYFAGKVNVTGALTAGGGTVWSSANDGPGSGLKADLLDDLDSTAFARNDHNHDDRYVIRGEPSSVTNVMLDVRSVTADKVSPAGSSAGQILKSDGSAVIWGTCDAVPPDNSVTSAKIKDGEVKEEDLGSDSVTALKIKDGTVGTLELADGAVTTVKIANGAVTGDKWADTVNVSKAVAEPNPLLILNNSSTGPCLRATTNGGQDAVYAETSKTNGYGVRGTANSGSSARGLYGLSNGGTGTEGWSSSGLGVRGISQSSTGVQGETGAFQGTGVFGISGSGDSAKGVYGSTASGMGVYGINTSSGNFGKLGTASEGAYGQGRASAQTGVYGSGYNGADGVTGFSASRYGIYGQTSSGYAGWFEGRTHVNGTLSKSGGQFKIDHPLDPANRYLCHSFVESPDMMNIYNGNVVLDAKGEARVQLPEWFEALNNDFRYQLTCIGGFAPVYIASKIADNRFRIAGGTPGLEVSWQVTGIRQDAWANQNRISVEEDKPTTEQGLYLHPEVFGEPEEMGIASLSRPR